ncbi:MAG: phospho-sugar mutase [Chlamydiales bacterium]
MPKTDMKIDVQTQKNVDSWLEGSYDEASKQEIKKLQQESPQELIDAFYQHLSFGTGGLRGKMGVGTNRLNIYTIRNATQGLANYILKSKTKKQHLVIIGYDSRHHSRQFAEESAKVLAANKIEVYLYKELRPVPLVSFGVLHKKCTAGIMITASHNPAVYNGYKVYWEHGAQVLPPDDVGIIEEVNKITEPSMVKVAKLNDPLIHEVNGEIDKAYLRAIAPLALHPGNNQTRGKELSIVYTSLHGAGITMTPKALESWGFTNLHFVEEQIQPNGDFPTVEKPNPEEHAALKLGIEQMKRKNADILIANDPDVDRIGVAVAHEKEYRVITGNEMAIMLIEHICRSLLSTKQMPPKAMFIKTIVTSELCKDIVEHYGASILDVLTGFKYIGEKMAGWAAENRRLVVTHQFIFGCEESYGYLFGSHVRDKDGVVLAPLIAEMSLQLKLQNKTLVDFLYEIYQKYGVFHNECVSLTFEGKEGAEKITSIMKQLRQSPPKRILKADVLKINDYFVHDTTSLPSGKKEPLLLPKSNVLVFCLSDHSKVIVRPSGTEPKIKFYCEVVDKHYHRDTHAIKKAINKCALHAAEIIEDLKRSIGAV